MLSRLLRLTGVITVLALLVPSTAQAADEIRLSNDGVTWSTSLSAPLFDPAFRWVPGDSETASFFVRNQGPSSARMTIEARSADTDELLQDDDISLQARVVGGEWVSLANGVASRSLTEQSIGHGGVVQLEVNATFDPASTNQSQTKRLALSFAVTLTDALDGGADGPTPDDDGSLLPTTGTLLSQQWLWIGAILVGTGLALAARRREREEEVTVDV